MLRTQNDLSNIDLAGVKSFSTSIDLTADILVEVFRGLCVGTTVKVTDSLLQQVIIHHQARIGCLRLGLGVLSTGVGVGGC